jgi:hypothetical protein
MAANVELVRNKVQKYLTSIGPVSIDSDGDYSLRAGSARVFVRVQAHPNGESTIVRVFTQAVSGVRLSPELYEFVATNTSTVFGTLSVFKNEDGTGMLVMRETLLGDFIDEEELKYAVLGIAFSTDEIDQELAERFGGRTFHDED